MIGNLKEVAAGMKNELNIFHPLSGEELDTIVPYLEINRYPKGTTFFSEGDSGDFFGIVTSGRLEAKKNTAFKRSPLVLAVLDKGSFVGELSMLDEKPRSATVVALEDSEVLILKRKALDEIAEKYPRTGNKIMKQISRVLSIRLRTSVDRLGTIF